MQTHEEQKNQFETLCLNLIAILDEEYSAAKANEYDKLNQINIRKAAQQEVFQDQLFEFTLNPRGIPDDLTGHIEAVHKASQRNAAYLAGAIDGVSTLIRELRRASEISTFTGLYNPDGSFRASEEAQQNLGKV
ncbi:MAG: hypothetical protein AAF621_06860 [Pseudomonadota bacterium]